MVLVILQSRNCLDDQKLLEDPAVAGVFNSVVDLTVAHPKTWDDVMPRAFLQGAMRKGQLKYALYCTYGDPLHCTPELEYRGLL